MSINKRIIDKINEKTEDDLSTRSFLLSILEKESDGLASFKNEYKQLLEKYREGWKKHEDQ